MVTKETQAQILEIFAADVGDGSEVDDADDGAEFGGGPRGGSSAGKKDAVYVHTSNSGRDIPNT